MLFISIFLVPMDLGTTFMFLSGAVMLIIGMGFFQPTGADYSLGEVATVETTRDVVRVFLHELPEFAGEVLISLFPIVAVFIIFQLITHRYQKRHIKE